MTYELRETGEPIPGYDGMTWKRLFDGDERGGLVADRECFGPAFPYVSAWVADDARVWPGAMIRGRVRIMENADIRDDAKVFGEVRVGGDAVIAGNAWLDGRAVVGESAVVTGGARVEGCCEVCGEATIFGSAVVAGYALVHGSASGGGGANIHGDAVIGDGLFSGNAMVTAGSFKDSEIEIFDWRHVMVVKNTTTTEPIISTLYRCRDGSFRISAGCWDGNGVEDFEEMLRGEDWPSGQPPHVLDTVRPEMLAMCAMFRERIKRVEAGLLPKGPSIKAETLETARQIREDALAFRK